MSSSFSPSLILFGLIEEIKYIELNKSNLNCWYNIALYEILVAQKFRKKSKKG